jgi:hypothetical protein
MKQRKGNLKRSVWPVECCAQQDYKNRLALRVLKIVKEGIVVPKPVCTTD